MKSGKSIFWGIIILAAGIIFFGNNFNLWNVQIFFDGWWTLFIIIPSIYGLFRKEYISSTFGLIVGILLLLASQDIIKWNMVAESIIPIILILIGLQLIFRKKPEVRLNKEGLAEFVGIFSGNEQKLSGKFEGASLVAVFGGVDIDLTKVKVDKDVVIETVSVFGGIDIIIPDGVNVKVSGLPIFGGAENKKEIEFDEKKPTIYINYVCAFGGLTIK